MKLLKTNKKFYNKWLYKVSLQVEGAASFRIYSLEQIHTMFEAHAEPPKTANWMISKIFAGRAEIEPLVNFLLTIDSKLWSKRIERDYFDFYTNDLDLYNDIAKKFNKSIVLKSEPDEALVDLLNSPQSIVCDKLPHDKYKYRVYLRPHKIANDKDTKRKILDWMVSQDPKITCTPAIQKWFMDTDWNWDRRYVLVDDEAMLVMLKLRGGEVVGKVYNYVIADK